MKMQVSEQGLLIPKELLADRQEVEIIEEQELIIIKTLKKTPSIWDLGKNPVECDVHDISQTIIF
jgi:hypothetical protein